jgi:hypothetical protein
MSTHEAPTDKPYGIRTRLLPDAPLQADHLLGPNWESRQWFATRAERDRALATLRDKHPWSRPGDVPALIHHVIDP